MKGSGDDLDDDFIADDIVALSDDEGFDDGGSQSDDVHREQGSPDDAERGPHDKANVEKKRKRREKLKERKAKVGCRLHRSTSHSQAPVTKAPKIGGGRRTY